MLDLAFGEPDCRCGVSSSAAMTVAALDARGAIVALKMEDSSSLRRPEIASGKAWSALATGFGTRNLAERA